MVSFAHIARNLNIQVILIGPEPRRVVVLPGVADHVAGDGNCLVLRVSPRFHADSTAMAAAPLQRGVACAKYVCHRGSAASVDGNAAGASKPQSFRKRHDRLNTD